MSNERPKALKIAITAQAIGIALFCLSLFASTPPPYLFTIGVGATCILIGCLAFLYLLKTALKSSKE